MNLKKRCLIPVLFLILIFVLSVIYFSIFKRLTIIQDESWKLVMPKGSYIELRMQLAKKGYRLSVKTVEVSDYSDIESVIDEIGKLDTGGFVLVSPVISSALKLHNINIKDNLKTSTIIGIGTEDLSRLFDIVLVSNTVSGWIEATSKALTTGDKVAVVYDDNSLVEGKAIYEALESKEIVKINKQEYGSLFSNEISKKFEDEGINVVFCPRVTDLDELVLNSPSQKWIVDYRFAGVVPKDQLVGVVSPALFSSIEVFLSPSIFDIGVNSGVLNYEYRKIR